VKNRMLQKGDMGQVVAVLGEKDVAQLCKDGPLELGKEGGVV